MMPMTARRDTLPHRDSGSPHEHVVQWAVGNGSATAFWLTRNPKRLDDLMVFVNGALKRPAEKGTANDYTFVPGSNKVTFAAAPTNLHPIAFVMVI
jgi:hypothetical protein